MGTVTAFQQRHPITPPPLPLWDSSAGATLFFSFSFTGSIDRP